MGPRVRIRPISLEIGAGLPDDRVALAKDDSQHERPNRDLDDSIDALLSEIDASCAQAEDQDKISSAAADAVGATAFEMAQDEPGGAGDDGPPGADGAGEETPAHAAPPGEDALSALDAVSGGAQSLIEDAIEDLLDGDAPEAHEAREDEPGAPPEPTGRGPAEPEAHPVERTAEGLGDDELLAQIADELSAPEDVKRQDKEDEGMLDGGSPPLATKAGEETPSVEGAAGEPEPQPEAEAGWAMNEEAEASPDGAPDRAPAQESAEGPGDGQPPHESGTVGALDEALAGMDDELLMGDFETPEGDLVETAGMDGSIDPAMLLDRLGIEEQAPGDESDGVTAEEQDNPTAPNERGTRAAADETSDAVSAVEAARAHRAKERAAPSTPIRPGAGEGFDATVPVDDEVIESVWRTAQRLGQAHGGRAWVLARDRGWPLAARVILRVSAPVKDKPAVVRDSIGYMALWTLLLAAVLWFYVAFIRTTPAPVPAQAPTRVMTPDETSGAVATGQEP